MKIREVIASGGSRNTLGKSWATRPVLVPGGLSRLIVHPSFGPKWRGRLHAGPVVLRCALGTSGIRADKREGDHATPAGRFRLLGLRQRHDRIPRLRAGLPALPIRPRDGWCDDAGAAGYNRPLALPARAGHERLYRDDHLYDLLVILDHNQRPRVRGRGSAIFFHLARPDFAGTEGCVAISRDDMRRLLPRLARHVWMRIG